MKTLANIIGAKEEKTKQNKGISEYKFIVISTFGELLDIAIQLDKVEHYPTYFCVLNDEYSKIGDGIVEKIKNWWEYIGQDYIWVIDGCEMAELQDFLRKNGEYVVGTNKKMSELEEDRQKGQAWFKSAGFNQPFSKNFTSFEDALSFIQGNKNKKWILKQNGNAPKHLNHKGKFDGNEDMIYHLEGLKKSWNESEYGKIDFDLMEIVDGTEIAASAFFNGHDFLRNKEGKIVGFLNFEEKKEIDGNLGETTGEMGTSFIGVTEDNKIFKDILLRPEIVKKLKETDYRGVFDINGCLTDKGFVSFEATSRFGVPASSYEFIEGLESECGELLGAMACGMDEIVEIYEGAGMVMVVAAKPYPVESDVEKEGTSLGEKLWIMKGGKPSKDFSSDQWKHIHLENIEKNENGDYLVATKNGYILTVTNRGTGIADSREKLIEYIQENIYIPGQKWRTDIGKRIEDFDIHT